MPKTVAEIADRRNELAGNLSLYQELGFIEKIDQMLEQGRLSRDSEYKHIVVRVIELSRSRLSLSLGAASKMNRDPGFIQDPDLARRWTGQRNSSQPSPSKTPGGAGTRTP